MKKLLSLLGAVALTATSSATVVACGNPGDTGGGGDENLPDTQFQLAQNSIDIDTVNPGLIKITNYDILNSNSMPTEFIISEPDAIQVTVSSIDKALIITPKNVDETINGITVTAKSKIHSVKFTVNVNKAADETQIKLASNEITMGTSLETSIKITNYDYLVDNAKPKELIFNDEYIDAEFDDSNHAIIIRSSNKITENLELQIIPYEGQPTNVLITIETQVLDLGQEDYITNVIAGNMDDYGIIDPSIAVGDSGFKITERSVLNSFNVMNGLNISAEDVNIIELDPGTNGMGALYTISAKNGSQFVQGEITLVLNQQIDPNEYFKNKNLGEIRLFEGAFNNLNEVLNSKDVISLGAIAFEVVGDRNKQLEYVKGNFTKNLGAAGQAIMNNAITTATTFQITDMPTLEGIFKTGVNVEFTFKFVKEDRITFYDALPESKYITLDKKLEEDQSPEGQIKLRTEVYNQLSQEFKDKISLEHFLRFSKVIYSSNRSSINSTKVTKIDILPGSPLLYGHDGAAFIGYINNPGGAAGLSGGGNLGKYEESKELDIKYTSGMGWFDTFAAMSGQFYQGHVVLNPVDLNSKYVTTPINDFSISRSEATKQVSFEIANLSAEDSVEIVSSKPNNISVDNLVVNETSKFTANVNYVKAPIIGSATTTISIKVNGEVISEFNVVTA